MRIGVRLAGMISTVLLVVAIPLGPAHGQTASPSGPGWTFDFTSYGWLASTVGSVGAGTLRAKVDNSFTDTIRDADSALSFMGRGELRNGRLGLFLDGQYTRLLYDDVRAGPLTVDAKSTLTVLEFGAAYQVLGDIARQDRAWALDALGGGRWTHLRNEISVVGGPGGSSTADWVDPFIGLRLRGRLAERWEYALRGDIGGFGVGTRFAWQANATLGYRFELLGLEATSIVGYRAIYQDYESRRLTYDVTLHGPVIGLNLRF